MRNLKTLVLALSFILAMVLTGCAGMTTAEKRAVGVDVLAGLQIVAAGVAGMPGADPVATYWSNYAAGVLKAKASANPTAP